MYDYSLLVLIYSNGLWLYWITKEGYFYATCKDETELLKSLIVYKLLMNKLDLMLLVNKSLNAAV